jgi:hypothetical protein
VDVQHLALAYVVDAHNIGCVVRFIGDHATHRARYSDAIQQSGVVIRTCHMVAVDQRDDSPEVVWRLGTVGTIETVAEGQVTLNLGYRTVTILHRDERPEAEHMPALVVGDRVLLRGSPIERAAITDVLRDNELAHPERLRARLSGVHLSCSLQAGGRAI